MSRQQEQITGILVFSEGKFAVLSKHITFFDTLNNKVEDMPKPLLTAKQVQIRKQILNERGLSELD